jgi:hypothetical protein
MTDVRLGESIVFQVTDRVAGRGTNSNQPVYSPRYARDVLANPPWPKQLYVRGIVKGYTAWTAAGAAPAAVSTSITPAWRNASDDLAGYTVEVSETTPQQQSSSDTPSSMPAGGAIVMLLGGAAGKVTLDVPRRWVSVTRPWSAPTTQRTGGGLPNDERPRCGQLETRYLYTSPFSYASAADVAVGTVVAYRGRVCVVTAAGTGLGLVCATRAATTIGASTPAQVTHADVAANEVMVLPGFSPCVPKYAKDQSVAWVARVGDACQLATVQSVWYTFGGAGLAATLDRNRAFDEPELRKANPNYAALDTRLYTAALLSSGSSCGVRYTLRNDATGAVQDAGATAAAQAARASAVTYAVEERLVAPPPMRRIGTVVHTRCDIWGFGDAYANMSEYSMRAQIIMYNSTVTCTVSAILLSDGADCSEVQYMGRPVKYMDFAAFEEGGYVGNIANVTHHSVKRTPQGLKCRYVLSWPSSGTRLIKWDGASITDPRGLRLPVRFDYTKKLGAGDVLLDESSDAWEHAYMSVINTQGLFEGMTPL